MAVSMVSLLFFCIPSVSFLQFASSSPLCPPQSHLFLYNLHSQCPFSILPSLPSEVDEDSLDIALSTGSRNTYTAVLFYASWCPFSYSAKYTFSVLSSMFPQIRHLTVEQSSAMPSLFSRYGVHSLPTLLIANHTTRVRYYGSKDLGSLVNFYKRVTGLEPIEYFMVVQPSSLGGSDKSYLQLQYVSSVKEMVSREPYLVFSLLFLFLRAVLYLFPEILSRLKAFWVSYVPHLNLGIFGKTTQLLGRVLNVIDVKRAWSKMRICKTRKFRNGAKNARVWASSLTSVSLGESSSARPSSMMDS